MKIFSELNENKNLALALGYFDGVHLGHQSVIKSAVKYAHTQNQKSAVITFKDHPCCFFWGVCPKYILSRNERRKKIEELGVDYLYELNFEDIADLSAQEYLENILIKHFSPISISTGYNHNFGYNKTGDTNYLNNMADKFGYKYFMTDAQSVDNEIISSTKIRTLLSCGNIKQANRMLGYNFTVEGIVIEGQKLGRQIGFRTANILYPSELIDLPFGVYSSVVKIGTEKFKGITNFGVRPTVSNTNTCTLETHLLNFNKDIYGETIRVEFLNMLRKEQKFGSLDELKTQIKKDILLRK